MMGKKENNDYLHVNKIFNFTIKSEQQSKYKQKDGNIGAALKKPHHQAISANHWCRYIS